MIYLKLGKQRVLILEPGNIAAIQAGRPLKTPDETVLVCYAPDVTWTSDRIQEMLEGGRELDVEKLDEILAEGLKRKPIYRGDLTMKRVL